MIKYILSLLLLFPSFFVLSQSSHLVYLNIDKEGNIKDVEIGLVLDKKPSHIRVKFSTSRKAFLYSARGRTVLLLVSPEFLHDYAPGTGKSPEELLLLNECSLLESREKNNYISKWEPPMDDLKKDEIDEIYLTIYFYSEDIDQEHIHINNKDFITK